MMSRTRPCAKTGARFGLTYLARHPLPWGPVIRSGPWAGWVELGYITDDAPAFRRSRPWRG